MNRNLKEVTEEILAEHPDPVVYYRLLRDVLKKPRDDQDIIQARHNLNHSRWVHQLEGEQCENGSWGRFHTMDTKKRQKIVTTEFGVTRARALGLDASHPILLKTIQYITGLLNHVIPFPDRREVTVPNWDDSIQLIQAATLAQIQPDAPILDGVWDRLYTTILQGYTRYNVAFLGSRVDRLPKDVEKKYVEQVWNHQGGIAYFGIPLSSPPQPLKGAIDKWFSSMEVLSLFPSWRLYAEDALNQLWELRNDRGFWDFGPRPAWSPHGGAWFPLSESWRKKGARQTDWTTRVLILLRTYCSG